MIRCSDGCILYTWRDLPGTGRQVGRVDGQEKIWGKLRKGRMIDMRVVDKCVV